MLDVLFVHNNFPGQYAFLAASLVASRKFRVAAIGSQTASPMPGVRLQRYGTSEESNAVHGFARRFDMECRRAEQVLYAASMLKASGIAPRIIFVHPGWGEALPLRQAFPDARLCVYGEFYYRPDGADVGFDPEFPSFGADGRVRIALRNAATLLALAEADIVVAPTEWQKSLFPREFQDKIRVIHDGVDSARLAPMEARFRHPAVGRVLTHRDEVITYAARSLEPYRGFHTFMRALPRLMKERPSAQICIAGDDRVSYGTLPDGGETWKEALLAEVGSELDLKRVHFLGRLAYDQYVALLRVSRVHTYLTYPFVLSWSLIEAMALGCVIVSSDTAPLHEVVRDGVNGLSVPFFDPDALARKVAAVARDPAGFAEIGRQARETVTTRYDFETVSRPRFEALIAELLADDFRTHGVPARLRPHEDKPLGTWPQRVPMSRAV